MQLQIHQADQASKGHPVRLAVRSDQPKNACRSVPCIYRVGECDEDEEDDDDNDDDNNRELMLLAASY